MFDVSDFVFLFETRLIVFAFRGPDSEEFLSELGVSGRGFMRFS